MRQVEKHVIERNDPRYTLIDAASFASKNLYNAALYETRQAYIFEGVYLNYNEMDRRMQSHEAYKALPAKVAQQVLKQVHNAWTSFFEAREEYRVHPEKFTGRPHLPKYKHKTEGRNLLVYTIQAIGRGKDGLKRRIIKPSKLNVRVKTLQDPKTIDEVRIVPKKGFYVVEVIYEKAVEQAEVHSTYYAGIDMGVNNLVALAANKPDSRSVLVNGRPVKSINQYYNKRRAELQSQLRRKGTSKRLERLTTKRNRRIEHYMHTTSRQIVDHLVKEGIGTLVIGKNDGWKQNINHGKRQNQNFVQIPHARLIEMLTYKAELVGITVIVTEESYTSKASLLDLDPLPVWKPEDKSKHTFSGKRVKRGLYRASDGREINSDVNGAGNTVRKVAPDAFGLRVVEDGGMLRVEDDGRVASLVVHPERFVIAPARTPKEKSRARAIKRYKSL
jgi:putative transposase